MKREWENHELVEHWTIDEEDQQLIRQKRGINRLSFALLLKFFQLKGRFPEKQYRVRARYVKKSATTPGMFAVQKFQDVVRR